MSRPTCTTCKCPCLILSLKCLYEGTSLLHAGLDSDKVYAFMDSAQLTHIKPILGDTCFTELCTALNNSRLATTDPDYAALDTTWQTLIDEFTELLVVATEFMYLTRMSFGKITKHGLHLVDIDMDVFKMMLQGRKAELRALKANAKQWLEYNSTTYTCVETEDTSCLDDNVTELDDPFGYFMVIE